MNVIIRAWPVKYLFSGGSPGAPVVNPDNIKLDIGGVVKTMDRTSIEESLWLRLLGLQATKDWESTRSGSQPKRLRINLSRELGSSYAHNHLVVWREGNRRLCEFVYGRVTIGKFTWSIEGFPVGKIPRKPSKKHPKPPVL